MTKIRAIAILSLCNFYVSEGRAADEGNWWEQTVKKIENAFGTNTDELPKPGTYKPKEGHMLFGEKHMMESIKRFGGTLPSPLATTKAIVTPTKAVATNRGQTFQPQSPFQVPVVWTPACAPQGGYSINDTIGSGVQDYELQSRVPFIQSTSTLYPQLPYDNSLGSSAGLYTNPYAYPPVPQQYPQAYPMQEAYNSQLGTRRPPAQIPQQQAIYTTPGVDNLAMQTWLPAQFPQLQTEETWSSIPTPPAKMPFISKNKVERMKRDELFTDQLLDFIYWDVVANPYKIEDIKDNPYIRQVLKGTPDHRLWMVVYSLKAFDFFPGLVNSIQKYADEKLLVTAQDMIGRMYLYGEEVKKDSKRGLNYLTLSDSQGFAMSQNVLGEYYWEQKNYHSSFESLFLAVTQGYIRTKINLGTLYQYGQGVEKNYDQALKYYFEANNYLSKNYILKFLQPIQAQHHDNFFSESEFFSTIEGQLAELISLYYIEAPALVSSSAEGPSSKIAQGQLGIYQMLVEATSVIDDLKTLTPGFAINCLLPIETITRGHNNLDAPFYIYFTSKMSKNSYMCLGEENVRMHDRLCSAINFFHEGFKSYFEVQKPVADYSGKEKECADFSNTILSLNQLLASDIPDAEKEVYQKELIQTRCKLALKKQEIANLQQASETNKNLKRDFPIFEGIYLLLENYLEAGVDLRNKTFLKEYPCLKFVAENTKK